MLRVLIAEDEWLVSFTLRAQLEQRRCKVIGVAASGEEAVQLCRTGHPDVVLMDIRMPGMGGLEATRQIMRERPTCVVMLTAFGDPVHIAQAEEAGAMAYLVKPVSADHIPPALEVAKRRFDEFQEILTEIPDLDRALQARRLVEKAKAILQKEAGDLESEGLKLLRKSAEEQSLTLAAAAEEVIAAANRQP